ncbi:MAG: MMPL family transporter [Alphaproteobacteria bacterium]|nr:MMPL family transporter [Alphaproteobacteria bacterium]
MDFKSITANSQFYLYAAPLVVLVVAVLFFAKVDLEPKITPDFFFSSDSEIYKQDQQIQKEFPFQQQVILSVDTAGSIADPNYIEKIGNLTTRIKALKGVDDVQSITNGPEDLEAALENPLWRRMLIGDSQESSFVVVFVNTDEFSDLVKDVEKIVESEENKWFSIRISGLPYIVEQIRRNLQSDMKVFTIGAIILSAMMLFAVFRSVLVVGGALIACATGSMLTLVVQSFIGIPIGILTANLGAIVFVLTLSHIIFLVSNWWNDSHKNDDAKLKHTIGHTLPASFWAAMTTLLGFASLIFVEAKPLNQLGIGGSIGTASALLCAYTIFPGFLGLAKVNPTKFTYTLAKKFPLPKKVAIGLTFVAVITAMLFGFLGIARLNTDPSLLAYFEKDSKLYKGIYQVDKNGGSNPLLFVVKRQDGSKLDNSNSYEMMWDMQNALAKHEPVGSVISLPVIMAEGDEHWLGQLLPWNMLLDILEKPKYGAIAKSFVNEERTKALFMMRMKESGRDRDRLEIVEEIEKIPAQHGFTVTNVGGTYYLQGELAASVAQSMTTGILALITLFGVIAFIVSGTIMVAIGVMICAAIISAVVLGTLGLFGIPVDIISSPAINICLGLIVDDMLHLTVTAKRHAKEMKDGSLRKWDAFKEALDTQSWPAIISTLTIMIGFSVFALSDFPPSQRFGLEIVYGAALAVILALGVFPFIATRKFKKN